MLGSVTFFRYEIKLCECAVAPEGRRQICWREQFQLLRLRRAAHPRALDDAGPGLYRHRGAIRSPLRSLWR